MDVNTTCTQGNNTLCQDEGSGGEENATWAGGGGGGGGGVGGGGGGFQGGVGGRGGRRGHDWPLVREELQWAFPVHIYGFACLFFMLAFYTFFSILNLRSQISNRPFMSTINVFLCVLGVTRAACFLIDPYTSGQVMPGFLGSVMWDVGYPCILSAFSLIQLAFSQLTQVKFRPETLRRKSALSLVITTHFALVLGSDIVTAFESHLQVVRWVVQTVFLSWGLVLCVTFLYGGARILRLLQNIPHSAFQGSDGTASNSKGILQLALLAQCNNIASSVLTAAAPSLLTPKIKITDEHDHTFSYVSDSRHASSDLESGPASRRPSPRSSISGDCAGGGTSVPSTSGLRSHDTGASDIEEENEDQDSLVSPTLSRKSVGGGGAERGCDSPKQQPSPPRSPRSRKKESVKGGRRARVRGCEGERCGDIIIKVEDVEGEGEGSSGGEGPSGGGGGRSSPVGGAAAGKGASCPDGEHGCGEARRHVKVAREGKLSREEREEREALVSRAGREGKEGRDGTVQRASSLRSVGSSGRGAGQEAGRGGSSRRSSASEAGALTSDSEVPRSPGESEQRTALLLAEEAPPKRKKSLTWSEDTPTPDMSDKETRGGAPYLEETETPPRDTRRRASSSSRRSSRGGEKKKLRHTRSCELGEAAARRRSSGLSSASSQTHGFPGPGPSLPRPGLSSPSSVRRGSRRSVKDEAEVEALLARSPNGRQDVTLSSILNHIAYVNQAAASTRLPASFKDSRKAQVQQVLLVTYVTAVLGTLLSLALVYGLYRHFTAITHLRRPAWLWFVYESSCRFLEFLMGCAMANITRQPVNRHPQYPYSLRIKQRNSLYM
ncbi:uncharacterized protein LOC127008243 [Eriocheir sinensis]|uniref:uncharacterized protein LOC127008243 n=1 Tax=Eriocheir sinensis TaxID=95602 RepID=UPI0021C96D70|nr:uncharacterized protein LOC127008243 [Eriocheir sinensis]